MSDVQNQGQGVLNQIPTSDIIIHWGLSAVSVRPDCGGFVALHMQLVRYSADGRAMWRGLFSNAMQFHVLLHACSPDEARTAPLHGSR